jgi:hypothetical protein
MKLKHSDGWNIPASDPFYPDLPAVYRNVQMQLVFFEAAPEEIGQILPEPSSCTCLDCGKTTHDWAVTERWKLVSRREESTYPCMTYEVHDVYHDKKCRRCGRKETSYASRRRTRG